MVTLSERFDNYRRQFQRFLTSREIAAFNRYNQQTQRFNDLSAHIIISGEPRGGTTWLMELLQKEDHAIVWEPLLQDTIATYNDQDLVRELGLTPYIPENTQWPEAELFFKDLLSGHLPQGLHYNFGPNGNRLKKAQQLLFKFCRANMSLPWLTKNFPDIKPIYLVRHPLAVVASQLKFPALQRFSPPAYNLFDLQHGRYMDFFDLHTTKIKAIDSRTSMFANWWAIRNSIPYLHPNKRWLTVSYERLYLYPEAELERISVWLGTDVTSSALQKIRRPSATTISGSAIAEGGNQLANWQKQLSQQQVVEILEIAHSYGIDAYAEDLEPDYGKLGY